MMSRSTRDINGSKKYKGIRRRKWGKWVSEIRVPGRNERLWLGSYSSPEAAAMAHDVAVFALRRPCRLDKLNFPVETLPAPCFREEMSPLSVQKLASDAGMAVDAQIISQVFPHMDPNEAIKSEEIREEVAESDLMDSPLCRIDNRKCSYEGGVGYTTCGRESRDTSQEFETSISIEDYISDGGYFAIV